MTFAPQDTITRLEVERAFDRVEGRMQHKQDEILKAVADLKLSMNGQFARQGEILNRHDTAIGVLNDRSGRDVSARVAASVGVIAAAIAGFFSLR